MAAKVVAKIAGDLLGGGVELPDGEVAGVELIRELQDEHDANDAVGDAEGSVPESPAGNLRDSDGPGEGKEDEEREGEAVAGVVEVEQEMRCLDRGAEQQQRKSRQEAA